MTKMITRSLVLCYYNEDISWISNYLRNDLKIFVYDKSNSLSISQSNVTIVPSNNVRIVSEVAVKAITKIHKLDGPLGVKARNSNNNLIREKLNWDYNLSLREGISKTYNWINSQVNKKTKNENFYLGS